MYRIWSPFHARISFLRSLANLGNEAFAIDEFEQMYAEEGHKISAKGSLPDRIKDLLINVKDNRFSLNGKVKIFIQSKT